MTDASEERARRARIERAKRLMGGDVPSGTRDDTDEGWNEGRGDRDDDLRRDVPPHHGG